MPILATLIVVTLAGIVVLLVRQNAESPAVIAGTMSQASTDAGYPSETDEPDENAWPTSDTTGTSDSSASDSTTSSGSETATTGGPDAETNARASLDGTVLRDEAAVTSRLDGRYVVKLASKVAGTTDPLQTTASGSNTFQWADVQAEYDAIRTDPRIGSAVILMTRSDRIGKARVDPASGEAYYVTIADIGATDRDDVTAWCRQVYATDSEKVRNNKCLPMEFTAAR